MSWRGEAAPPECDPGGHARNSEAGQSRICAPAPSSRFDPRVLPSCRFQGEATYLKLNKSVPFVTDSGSPALSMKAALLPSQTLENSPENEDRSTGRWPWIIESAGE